MNLLIHKISALTALVAMLLVFGGCKNEALLDGFVPSESAVLVVADQSGSCWEQVRVIARGVAPLCTHVSMLGQKSPGALLTGGQGAAWELEVCGEQRKSLREKILAACESEGRVGEWGSDICAMLDRVQEFAADVEEGNVTVIIISDFVADPPKGAREGQRRPYRDPAEFQWNLPQPEKTRLRFYFTQDAEYTRLREAWQPQLKSVDARFFRPNHLPGKDDLS